MAFHLGKLAQVPISHLRTDTYMSGEAILLQFEEEDGHDMKLTRIDCNTGKVEIVDEFKLNSPLIYLCKLMKSISFYLCRKGRHRKNRICDINSRYNLFS